MPSGHPFFSVIVPTYNHAQYLGGALDSLLAQSDPDWEAVVVNDGSTDGTCAVLDDYCERDRRIRAVHKANGGVASALNAGLAVATGEWMCWLSSDDLFDWGKLALHREAIVRAPSCRFFFTSFGFLDEATGRIIDLPVGDNSDPTWQLLDLLDHNTISGNTICVHRDALARIGNFDDRLRYAQDYDMWLRLMVHFPATLLPDSTAIVRLHSQQGTARFPEACSYDAAKAAINLLNRHNFAELIPLADLSDPDMARRAIVKALTIATHASPGQGCSLYALGPHPALLFRIVEWVWAPSDHGGRGVLRQIVQMWANQVAHLYRNTPFGCYWQAVAALDRFTPHEFSYQAISPPELAEASYWLLRSRHRPEAATLDRYFREFERRPLPHEAPAGWQTYWSVDLLRFLGQANLTGTMSLCAMMGSKSLYPMTASSGDTARTPPTHVLGTNSGTQATAGRRWPGPVAAAALRCMRSQHPTVTRHDAADHPAMVQKLGWIPFPALAAMCSCRPLWRMKPWWFLIIHSTVVGRYALRLRGRLRNRIRRRQARGQPLVADSATVDLI